MNREKVNELVNSLKQINDNLSGMQEEIEIDESASPDAVKRIEQLVQYK
jgi:hypothetical protein